MNGSRINNILLVAILFTLLLSTLAPFYSSADILSEKPHYISTQVVFFFKTEDSAELKVNYSWYGLWANDLERLLNKIGEENYTRGFISKVNKTVNGPFIGGDMEFYPTSIKARIVKSTYKNISKRIDLILTAELEARKGSPRVSGGRKGIVYSTREDYSNVSKLFVKELDLLNMTVILPKDYVVSIARPSPNLIYPVKVSNETRIAVSWLLKSPTVDTRESSGYSGWFFLGVVNHTRSEIEMLDELRNKITEIRKSGSLTMDERVANNTKKLFELYYELSTLAPNRVNGNLSYALKLAKEIPISPISSEMLIASASIAITILEIVGYFVHRRRFGR